MTRNPRKLSIAFVAVLMVFAAGCTAVGSVADTNADTNAQLQQNGTTETPTTPTETPTETPMASIVFENQTIDGATVVVESVTLSGGGFVAIHNMNLSVIGVSEFLPAGTHENVEITLFEVPGRTLAEGRTLTVNQTLIAMAHLDTNDNEAYDFLTLNTTNDGPYTQNGSAVVDSAFVTVADKTATPTPTETPEEPTESAAEEGVTYYQVDFVATDPIENLRGPEGTYTDDQLIRFLHGSTENPVVRRAPGVLAYAENNELAERIESQEIAVENGTATITFTVADGSAPVELSLVSYTKPGPGWSPATEAKQEFIDAETDTFGPGTYTLTVELPGDGNETDGTQSAAEEGEGELSVVGLSADADGDDNNNLNDEYIVYENTGDATLNLSGWTVTDASGNTFTFPDGFTLAPGEQVTLYTGSGTNTDSALYWGQATEVWNNGADTMTVRNADGEIVLQRSYP